MRIFYSPYQITLKSAANRATENKLHGFLIKIQTEDFEAGYGDCLPWKIFGDGSVPQMLQRLRAGNLNELLMRSLYYATLDGQARAKRISLFDPGVQVRGHYTCLDLSELNPKKLTQLAGKGYKTIKIKLGRNTTKEAKLCSSLSKEIFSLFRWRLDFNGVGGNEFLAKCDEGFLSCVEYVEDPSQFDLVEWKALSKKFGVKIAFDQPAGAPGASCYRGVRIIKPARQSIALRAIDVLTNSMDHPIGQSFAFLEAQRCVASFGKQPMDYGIKTNHLLKPSSFSLQIYDDSPYFSYSDGYGVGFSKLLERQKWQNL